MRLSACNYKLRVYSTWTETIDNWKISLDFLFLSRIILKLKKEKPVYFLKGRISLRIVLHKKVIEITNKTLYSHFWPVSQDLAAS